MKKNIVTAAQIGCGKFAWHQDLPNMSRSERINLKWVCDLDLEHAKKSAAKFNVPCVTNNFMDIVNDPEVDMIIPTRGGKGAQDLVGLIDWQKVKERNLYLMGFSNITYITSAMEFHKAGRPIAGPNVGRLASATQGAKKHLKAVLAKKDIPPFKLTALRKGDASGRIYAGHLGMLQGNHASKFKVVPDNRVVFIECVNRDTATYDKLFGKLLKKGYFDKVKAVVFCHFNGMKDPQNMDALLEKWASQLKCPVYKGYPYGHKNDNYALDFSITANIKDDTLYFECGK